MTDWSSANWWVNNTATNRRFRAAMDLVLARWEAREPGRILILPGCNYATLVGYSPNFRVLHYRLRDGSLGWITRREYLRSRKP